MNPRTQAAIALVLALAGSSGIATAQPVDTAEQLLERMDRNVDGKISFEEYRNAMVRRFDAIDVDGDGTLEAQEIPPEWLAVTGATVSRLDFGDSLQPVYDRFDANKDGQMDAAEIAAFAAARKTQEEPGA
jgi:Ca2+-binding EF-hand superfamily protein